MTYVQTLMLGIITQLLWDAEGVHISVFDITSFKYDDVMEVPARVLDSENGIFRTMPCSPRAFLGYYLNHQGDVYQISVASCVSQLTSTL